ncbi:MAG: helix-turn-helix domain-containing protein [Porticoccaceae bacterium]
MSDTSVTADSGSPIEPIYTPEEIAIIMGVKIETVRDYLKRGSLIGFKFGKQWRVTHTELQAFAKTKFKIRSAAETGHVL